MTRDEMITILDLETNYNLFYLKSLSLEKLEQLFREKFDNGED